MANDFTEVKARELDFVTRFGNNWDALNEIIGVTRAIKKTSGTVLKSYEAKAVSGLKKSPKAGETIEATDFEVKEVLKGDIEIEKYRKSVTVEDVSKYGSEVAVEKTDDAFLNELQGNVMDRFYNFLHTGSLTVEAKTFQGGLAMAKANVLNKFNKIRKNVTEVVGFVNVLDAYEYLGDAALSTQTLFGIQYLKDFMGYKTLFLLSEPQVERGKIYATPIENIDLYYVDPADADFKKLGLEFTVSGETNLIGFHANGNYSNATGDSYALMGITLWAEYLDAIANVTITPATGA